MSLFFSLQIELSEYLNNDQIDSVHQAFNFAESAHVSQKRSSGEPYITHPLSVAVILAKMRLDRQTIIAALLHDILEDTEISKATIIEKFGEVVANLVDGVSKLTQIEFETRAEAQAENFRKMVMAMANDIRVILIKLADRLHNMRTLHHLDSGRRLRIAKESLEIYAPIAHRLGMHNFKIELEELSFLKLYPMRYGVLGNAVKTSRGNRKGVVSAIHNTIDNALKDRKIACYEIKSREKTLYSIYKKMRKKHLRLSEIMDVYAFRIVVNSIDDCYRTLGVVHGMYKPIPAKFKDYIAIPKVNGYQSLHTVLFGPYGVPIEIQIRTIEMDKMAENGIAAHWLYKSEDSVINQAQLRARQWIKGLLEIQKNAGDSLEFIENVKIDLFPDEVYVFTPKGEILELPRGSTPVDFAYAVHSDVGNGCVATKIDRRLAPLSTRLRSGQTVQVIVSTKSRPNPAWLDFVVTARARSRIRAALKQQGKSELISLGKLLVEKALDNLNKKLDSLDKETVDLVLKSAKLKTMDDLFEQVGLGNQLSQVVAQKLSDRTYFNLTRSIGIESKKPDPLYIKGSDGTAISFAKCCYPIPGDPIIGILTSGKGIVVHNEGCKNVADCVDKSDKCMPLRWEENVIGHFETVLQIDVAKQRGALASIALAIADADANIDNVEIGERNDQFSQIRLVVTVDGNAQLERIIKAIHILKNVTRVVRDQNLSAISYD